MFSRSLKKIVSALFLCSLISASPVASYMPEIDVLECESFDSLKIPTELLAPALVNEFWNDVKRGDVEEYSELLDKHFQGLNTAGIYNKDDQIAGLQALTVTSFQINNLIASRHHNTIVISYLFLAEGEGIVSGPNIDVWQKIHHKWRLVSHSYVPFQQPV